MSNTNQRGETPHEAFETAIVEVFAPVLRDTLMYGREPPSSDVLSDRLAYQLEHRGFTITNND